MIMSHQRVRTLFSFLLLAVVTAGCSSESPSEPEPSPTVTGITPNAGPIAGATSVTITGTGFVAVPSVTFGGTPATGIAFSGSTSIVATAPANAAGAVSVVVTNPDAQSGTLASGFTYTAPPVVTSVTPNSGSAAGSTAITIAGTGFVAGATVTIGGNAATGVSVAGSTSVTATTPAHAAGAVDIVVTNPDGQSSTLANAFTYVAAPTVTGVTPNSGPPAGGVQVTITGTGFTAVPTVTFDGSAATGVAFVSSTQVVATAPAHAAGAVAVTVTNPDGQSGVLPNGFTYAALPAPQPTSVSPASGRAAGGYTVTITGTGFVANATVTFGGTAATNVAFASATTITATVPAHDAGAVAVVVTNPDGQSGTLANGFTYVAPPTVTSISPASGGIGGGEDITITGTGFVEGTTVRFGSDPAIETGFFSATVIIATTPAHAAGAVDVTVTNPDGQFVTVSNGFTYLAPTPLEKADWQVDYAYSGGSYRHDARLEQDALGVLTGSVYDGSAEKTIITSAGSKVTGDNVVLVFELRRGNVSDGFVTCTGVISKPAGQPQRIEGTFTAANLAAVGGLTGTCVLQ
jgi:hypothetical protein